MRFATCTTIEYGELVGIVEEDRVHTLDPGVTLLSLLEEEGSLHDAGARALRRPFTVIDLASARLQSPLPVPTSIRDFNTFESHTEGTLKLLGAKPDDMWFEIPAFYFTNPHAVVGPHDDVPIPPGCELFDLELEVAAVIGKAGRNLTVEQAEDHIIGYTILNDWSARDVQFKEMRVGLGPAKGKDTATTLGPYLVTKDELEPYRAGSSYDLTMQCHINDTLLGTDTLANMAWTFPQLVSYASRGTHVKPGDVLGSGTCGMGCLAELWGRQGYDAHPPLQIGDTVTLTVQGLGQTTNTITTGDPLHPLR